MAVPFAELSAALRQGRAVVAGLLSGTSCDGIDVALVGFDRPAPGARLGAPRLLAFELFPYPEDLAARARELIGGRAHPPRALALFARDFGRACGLAARALAERRGLDLDLAGSHGQTVWHHDGVDPGGRASLQLGDGDAVAEAARCTVACDFRQRDLAAGGEGAPILALVEHVLFPDLEPPAAVLNLGGIANLTVLPEPGGALVSFDVGPANCLLDGLARLRFDRECDRDGAAALAGHAHPGVVAAILAHPFFVRAPPKSTGRDTFGAEWIAGVSKNASRLSGEDLMASATAAVALSVARALERWAPRARRLVVAGGGAQNPALLRELAAHAALPVSVSSAHGVDPKAREALAFAVLAAHAVLGLPISDPSATGASSGRVLGKLCPWWGTEG